MQRREGGVSGARRAGPRSPLRERRAGPRSPLRMFPTRPRPVPRGAACSRGLGLQQGVVGARTAALGARVDREVILRQGHIPLLQALNLVLCELLDAHLRGGRRGQGLASRV